MPTSESAVIGGTSGNAVLFPPPAPNPPAKRRRRYWQKIGVELEGGWTGDNRRFLLASPLVDVKEDGSVDVEADSSGEVTLGPYDRLPRLVAMMARCYPEAVDESCGLHVHLSYDRPTVHRLSAPAFLEHFKAFWTRWGDVNRIVRSSPFWSRLEGHNHYCETNHPAIEGMYHQYSDEYQSSPLAGLTGNGNRYTQINYCSFREHGTVECRLLPAFKYARVAARAVLGVVECFESYLANPSIEGARAPALPFESVPHPRSSSSECQRRAKDKRRRFIRESRTKFTIGSGYSWCYRHNRYHPPNSGCENY